MTVTEMKTGTCQCGAEVSREIPPPTAENVYLRKWIRNRPLMCDECIERDRIAHEEESQRKAEEAERDQAYLRTKNSGLPEKYHASTLDSLDHPASVVDACHDWAKYGGGLLLSGEIGRGKTTLAGAAASEALRRKPLRWTSAPLLFARLGSGFKSEMHGWALEVLGGTCALVLDDIDKARPTEFGAEQVFLAVDQRVEHNSPLLVTSNLTPGQLADRWPPPYGEAIASRLVGYCKVVMVEGVDRRLRGAA